MVGPDWPVMRRLGEGGKRYRKERRRRGEKGKVDDYGVGTVAAVAGPSPGTTGAGGVSARCTLLVRV